MSVGYKDLREWLAETERMGELKIARSVDLEEDVGRIAEISASTEEGPTVLLDEFEGYEKGYRILLNPYGSTRQIAWTFGFPKEHDRLKLLELFKERLGKIDPIPPKYVEKGPILENVRVGEEVDLMRFPVPKWHKDDGGYYIGTGCLVITRDPEEGWVNVGTYRCQRHNGRTVGFYVSPAHHGGMHRDKYFSRGERCPVAVVFGSDPLLFNASMTEVPWGVCEYDWVGGWRNEPVEVIKGPVTGLPIPAHAEIAIEGFSHPGKTMLEGQFGEWAGYYASGASQVPYIDIEALYFRNDPIILGITAQKPPADEDKIRQYIKSALLVHELKHFGIAGVTNAWCHGFGNCRLFVAVAIRQLYPGHSIQVGHAAYASTVANYCGRYVVVVDDDIDPTDINDVMWAVSTRSDPATSIEFIRRATSTPLDPRITPEERAAKHWFNSRAIIDATMPFEWKAEFPKPVRPDAEYRRESRRKFGYLLKYGPDDAGHGR